MGTILVNETIKTEKGDLIVLIDAEQVINDVQRYKDKFMQARGIPFDIDDLIPTDNIVAIASQQMPWADPSEVIRSVKDHYRKLEAVAKNDGAVIAITRTSKFDFEPEPYSPVQQDKDEWDISLPDPIRNLNNPIERRYKQIIDVVGSDPVAANRFWQIMETISVVAEREVRRLDEDGFQSGRSGGTISKKVKSKSQNE